MRHAVVSIIKKDYHCKITKYVVNIHTTALNLATICCSKVMTPKKLFLRSELIFVIFALHNFLTTSEMLMCS
jgi:hypothetical protein